MHYRQLALSPSLLMYANERILCNFFKIFINKSNGNVTRYPVTQTTFQFEQKHFFKTFLSIMAFIEIWVCHQYMLICFPPSLSATCFVHKGQMHNGGKAYFQPSCSCSFYTNNCFLVSLLKIQSVAAQNKIIAPIISCTGYSPVIFLADTNLHSLPNHIRLKPP